MSRAAQFAVVVAVAGMLVLGAGTAAPRRPAPRGIVSQADVVARLDATARARAIASLDAQSRAIGPGYCFAGRPCPRSDAPICFAGATAPRDAKAATAPCSKADVTFRFADTPPRERP
jgi:hypothetical protein